MEGEDLEDINAAVRKVSYINSRQFPTPGVRRLHITTSVQCFGEDTCLSVPDLDTVVMVLQPSEPRITIGGTERLRRPASDLRASSGLALAMCIPGILEEIIHNLDYCDILVLGDELRPEQESLQLERSSLLGMHLDATNSTSGMSVYGVDSMANYEQVIRQVRYRRWHPGTLQDRRFRLTCSELNGRYTSNEFNLEVSVLRDSDASDHVNYMVAPPQYMHMVHQPSSPGHNLYPGPGSEVPSAATVQEAKLVENKDEAWDDSALSITNLAQPPATEEEDGSEEDEEEEDDDEDEEEDEDDITSTESDDSEEEADVQLPRIQTSSKKGHSLDKATISY
ncbi:hypothetical protein NHX12_009244 [Muraenolepis orangiensis]|uniref:Calsyntenin C-terminal domain-containing protein n=1 Tax=Muraenolepis orangiensis TaxID=630683 RepID=A0A9Q0IB06_9TELE|nr:hypothetical protein NHX12_009244 [Muraenolepis orangiensis]